MMINEETRRTIKAYLGGFIQGLTEQRCPEFRLTPMGEARAFYSTFEECARLIALQTYAAAERGYRASGTMPVAAVAKIEEIVSHINEGHTPDFPALVAEVLEASDEEWVERPAIADLYLRDKAGHEYFFEIKSPRPNKGQCLEVAERLLRIHAIKQKNRPYVNAYFAMAYNPYGTRLEDYRHSFSLQYLDMQSEVLLGADFWTLVGGEGTYEELLEIYREVGREKGKAMIDALAFGS
jgi:hypothetical protein